ncbi:potassium channel family protein [Arenivirga flava]|uniref:Potassium transporter n=1 Tax=Arenivirga flava TaxID=1930060 RepID=A0AA37X9W1_9MICO|nr:TrkA family potassium uptake protein [Arenivirga flava]GMA29009.1 potassium transporter [Arenivirga flava]
MARRNATRDAQSVAVIGLGRFGRALAIELVDSGAEVLGIDTDEDIVQSLNGVLTHVVRADSTREAALEQLGIDSFDRVVIAIGSDIQASILTASLLKRRGTVEIWAKAISEQHGLILEQIGISHVVYPEADMGRRVAHLVRGSMLDYVRLDDDLVVAVTQVPGEATGGAIGELQLHEKHGVGVIRVKRDGRWMPVAPDTALVSGETIVVIGPEKQTERFCSLSPAV